MKKSILSLLILLMGPPVFADGYDTGPAPVLVEEIDGSPSGIFYKIKATNGSVTNNLDGSVTIATGGGGGAPTDADYLVGTANGTLSNEIAVGTTPGGELGGSWSSPTLDDSVTVTGWVLGTSSATTLTAGTVNIDLLDAVGAVDMDYGSADVTDHAFVSDGGTVTIDGSVVAAAGMNLGTSQALIGTTAMTIGNNAQTVAVNSSDWDIDATGVQTGMGNITSNGTIEGATITEGGNAVYNSSEVPGGELGGTYASPTIDDSVTVTGWTLGTSAVTDDAYAAGWNGSSNIPTKNALYDKIETLGAAGGGFTDNGTTVVLTTVTDNVGIGTTTQSGTNKLTIVGGIATDTLSGSGAGPMAITNGNIGIGTFATPTVLLHIGETAGTPTSVGANDVYVKNDLEVDGLIYGDGSQLTGIGAGGWTDGGTNVYTSTTTDNVGIGTTTPSTTLEIVKQASSAPLMVSSTATGDGNFMIIKSDGNVGIGTVAPVGGLVVMNGNVGIGTHSPTGKLQIGGSGNVGIGTLNPLNTLTVNGTFVVHNTNDMGWVPIDPADNIACNTSCVSACVMGVLNATGTAVTGFVLCSDATADTCWCAGPN